MTRLLSLAALAALSLAPAATAQTRFSVGAGFDVDRDVPYVGAGVRVQARTMPLTIAPQVDVYLRENVTDLQFNLDGLYHFPGASFSPYLGAGLGLGYAKPENGDGDTDLGLNLLFGADMGGARVKPYVQARFTVGGGNGVGVGGGLVF